MIEYRYHDKDVIFEGFNNPELRLIVNYDDVDHDAVDRDLPRILRALRAAEL